MLTLSILVFTVVLLASVISIGIRLAWGATKFIFGLGLFWFCPLLFVWWVQPHLAADRNSWTAVRRWI